MAELEHKVNIDNLPFNPVRGQVIYVDSDNNKRINAFIVGNYEWLRSMFREKGLEFCYLPLLEEELISYHAPYLNDKQRQNLLGNVPSITDLLKLDDEESLSPSLLYASDVDGEMRIMSIKAQSDNELKHVFTTLADSIARNLSENTNQRVEDLLNEPLIHYSLTRENYDIEYADEDGPDILFRDDDNDDIGDYDFDAESEMLISEIRERIKALRNRGVNTMILHSIVDQGQCVSPLHITSDYRIILPEYNNLEIVMPALPKAVFILFLRHPEGLRFKDLVDHRDELLSIYRALNPIGGTQRQKQSIESITNPMSNSINEKCARIKEAFVQHFDDSLARNYYITGKKGEPKLIALPPALIIWEQ